MNGANTKSSKFFLQCYNWEECFMDMKKPSLAAYLVGQGYIWVKEDEISIAPELCSVYDIVWFEMIHISALE